MQISDGLVLTSFACNNVQLIDDNLFHCAFIVSSVP